MLLADTVITRSYTFEEEGTCKYSWTFTLENTAQGWIIVDLSIAERENPRGCFGHPKTITALLKGRTLNSLNPEDLAEASCNRTMSCGQALAHSLDDLHTELT